MIKSIITDRKYYQEDAIESILKPKGGEPNLEGFAIALPYTKNVEQIDKNNKVNFIEKTFYNCSGLKCVALPATIKYIKNDAFNECSNISTVFYAGASPRHKSRAYSRVKRTL